MELIKVYEVIQEMTWQEITAIIVIVLLLILAMYFIFWGDDNP